MKNKIKKKIIFIKIVLFVMLINFSNTESREMEETNNINLPKPEHIVIVILENHSYKAITESKAAPYINRLAKEGALFSQSYALTNPSQPNYIMLFSGSQQGVYLNSTPQNTPFTTENLGAALLKKGFSFTGYSEDLPEVGFKGDRSGYYVRKHNPWVNWQGSCENCLPAISNQPFKNFPADFNNLPTVSFVVPNLLNDMHDGIDSKRISLADKWVKQNLRDYIRWTENNNSLLIITFDEDDYFNNNKITTIFYGEPVKQGIYGKKINHYSILRTIEDIYGLPYAGESAKVEPVTDCWKPVLYK
jgi:phospholipase C